MTFPSRPIKNLSVRVKPPCRVIVPACFAKAVVPPPLRNPDPCPEGAYRASCLAFLHAALNGAPKKRLKELAKVMWGRREALMCGDDCLIGPGPQGVPTGDQGLSR